ncbi:MAG: hypothetical protein AAGF11_00190 [Myxococcota bacterium]
MTNKIALQTFTKPRAVTRDDDFIRDVAGAIAVALAATAEGRAVGLSVEIWPEHDVALRVRTGHELRIFVDRPGGAMEIHWERADPGPTGGHPKTSEGVLGGLDQTGAEDLRVFMAEWLAWRVRG